MRIISLLLISLVLCSAFAGITMDRDLKHGHSQSYFDGLKTINRDGKIQVHIIAHSHDDVGWLKTVDQYYSGDRDDIQRAGVVYILNGVYDALMKDPTKKFTYVEMAFFQRWWNEQTEEVQKNVQMLVDEGRLQFVNAGMSMSDEATVHYEDFLNNMKAGHDFLKAELGYRPTIGWQIDPFGHHSATAALFAEMGFNAWFFARIDHKDKDRRLEDKEMEWLYRPFSESLGERGEIFTHMMYQHYNAPEGFGFNEFRTDAPIVDDPKLDTYNVDNRTEELHNYLLHMADHYRTDHLLVPFGDDFNFLNAGKMFYNIDKLIKNFNARYDDFELFYSTPNEYVDAVHEANIEWPTKHDDLFPYSDGDDAYWTGYFTSRANMKGYVREVARDMHTFGFMAAFESLVNGITDFETYEDLYTQMGVLQHHDGVSGTSKQHVADDYVKNLHKVHSSAKENFLGAFNRLQPSDKKFSMCLSHNSTFTDCPTKELLKDEIDVVAIIVVNMANSRNSLGKVPLPNSKVTLLDASREEVPIDIICEGATSENCEGFFEVTANTWGKGIFYLQKTQEENHLRANANAEELTFGSMSMKVTGIKDDIELELTNKEGLTQGVLMNYLYYNSYQDILGQKSGAYIFRPSIPDEEPKRYSGIYTYDGFKGTYMSQYRFYGSQVTNYVTGNAFTDFVEIKSDLKGIPLGFEGQEVILHLGFPQIQNEGVFYTDSMGMEMQERKVNYRPTWEHESTQPISENYYPVNHGITIKDDDMTLEVLNDRSQGGSSLQDGSVEFMIQRRTYKDDGRGVGEALNESIDSDGSGLRVVTSHYLRFYNNTVEHDFLQDSREMQRQIDAPYTYVFVNGFKEDEALEDTLSFTLENTILPDNIKSVLQPQKDGTIFARFENIMDIITFNETSVIDIQKLGESFGEKYGRPLVSITEVSNTGLYTMEEMQEIRYKWKGIDYTTKEVDYSSTLSHIEIGPQRIRSFVFEFEHGSNLISE